jgi:hypothetical protein
MLFQQLINVLFSTTLLSTPPPPEARSTQPTWLGDGGVTVRGSGGSVSLRIRDLGEEVPRRVAEDSLIYDLTATIERGDFELAVTINTGVDAPWKAPEWTAPLVEQMQESPRVPFTVTANASYRF